MKTILMLPFIVAGLISFSQTNVELGNYSFELNGKAKLENYKNQDCINSAQGFASVNDLTFKDGTIEFDMCVQQMRGFAGLRFRAQGNNSEEFYIRMHQSGNPDAMQYTPVYNGNAGWQLYHGDGYGAVKEYKFDEWFHVRLSVSGTRGEVYIEDMEKPTLVIHELKRGLTTGDVVFYGPARFANVKISIDEPVLRGEFKDIEKAGNEVVKSYRVSQPFSHKKLIESSVLPNDFVSELTFQKAETEHDGLVNLSKYAAKTKEEDAVLVQFDVQADEDLTSAIQLGFSDGAKVFVNGQAVWMGIDRYRSRDYRYLGTIGYFDFVYLNLKEGKNTISVMVAESFGGWGLKSKFNDLKGIQFY